MIQTGMFNKKVSFYKVTTEVNDFGVHGTRTYEKLFDSYVYTSHLRNNEFWEAKRFNDKSKLRIRIRYHPRISELNNRDSFVEIDGEYWNILSVENILNRNMEFLLYLELKKDGYKD